jgi:acyl dehydratase
MRPGEELAPLRKEPVTKEQLVKYARASGDYNLIHTDDETARRVGLDGVIAHGMLSMGFLGQYVAGLGGPGMVRRLKVRFAAMVRPGDELTCRAVVREVAGERALLDVWAENQHGEKVTAGEAEVEIG